MSRLIEAKTLMELLSTIFEPSEMLVDGLPHIICIRAVPQKNRKALRAIDLCCSIVAGASGVEREMVQVEYLYYGLEDTECSHGWNN